MGLPPRVVALLRLALPLLVVGLIELMVPAAQAAAPSNDDYASAAPITFDAPASGTTVDATVEPGETAPGYVAGTVLRSVWYTWTAPSTTPVMFTATASAGGTGPMWVNVYAGTSFTGTPIVTRDSGRGFMATAGATYHVQVATLDPKQGAFELQVVHAAQITGRVTFHGAPLADSMVVYAPGEWVRTAADGTYAMVLPSGARTLLFEGAKGAGPRRVDVTAPAGGTMTLNEALVDAGTITGTITPSYGAYSCVDAVPVDPAYDGVEACADAAGHYRINGLGATAYRLIFYLDRTFVVGYRNVTSEDVAGTPIDVAAGCTTTVNADLNAKTTSLAVRSCSQPALCANAKTALASATHRVKHDKRLVKKAKKKATRTRGRAHAKAKEKVKKLRKRLTKAKRAARAAAASASSACR